MQVWNINPVNGVVGVFNVQGSSWSRKKRAFYTHDPNPPVLQTLVTPTDIHTFAQSSSAPQHFVMYSDQSKHFTLAAHQEELTIRLQPGKSDVVTVAPVFGVGGEVQAACIGFVNMLNPGGGILKVTMDQAQGSRGFAVCEVLTKGCGDLMMYISQSPLLVTASGCRVTFTYNDNQRMLTIELPQASDLQRLVRIEL